MNLVAIEAPTARVALTGKLLKLLDAAFGVIAGGDRLQVVPDQLVEALSKGLRPFARAGYELVVNGQSDIH